MRHAAFGASPARSRLVSTSASRRRPQSGCAAQIGVEGQVAGGRRLAVDDERAVEHEHATRRQRPAAPRISAVQVAQGEMCSMLAL